MNDKLYIKKFIRDDGEKLSFDGEQLYLAQENTLLVRPDPSTTAVNFTEADGGEMIHQQNTTYDQPVNGLIIPKSTDYWTLTKQLSLFFKVNHTYKIVYTKKDGSMFAASNAWISSGLQIVPVPHEEYSAWSITMTIGNVNWTEYAEDSQGNEIYSNTITLPLLSSATGGEEWEYEEQDPVSKEGSDITFDDTVAGAEITDLTLKGDTFQQTYSGKNLFNKNGTYITAGGTGESVSVIDTGIKVTYGTAGGSVAARFMIGEASALVGKTITLSANVSKSASGLAPGMYIGVSNANMSSVQRMSDYVSGTGSKSVSWTVTEDISKPYIMVALYVTNGGTPSQGDYSSYENAQLEVGSTPTTYEPYTAGPAPNPDYPQDIDVVTGEQNVWVHGKNLFNKDATPTLITPSTMTTTPLNDGVRVGITQNSKWQAAIYIIGLAEKYIGKTVTLTSTITPSATNDANMYIGFCNQDGTSRLGVVTRQTSGSISYTITSVNTERPYLCVVLYGNNNSTTASNGDYIDYTGVQLEIGSATTYQPYQSQAYTVDLGSTELCKIGTYQDYIYKSGDDWYVHKDIGKSVLNGSEGWVQHAYTVNNVIGFRLDVGAANSDGGVLANYFKPVTWSSYQASGAEGRTYGTITTADSASSPNTNIYITQPSATVTNLAQFQTWLSTHNATAYYALATPTDTIITDNTLIGELEALYAAQGYNGKTIITVSATGTNLPAILAVTLQNPPITGEVWDNVGTVWELGSGGPQTINIDSTTTVYPVWVVQGPCINPTLQNNTTDTLAQYDGTVAAGQTLTVDFAEGTAHLDSALVTRYVSGLVSLRPGDNTLGFNSDGGATETSTISWNNVIN